MSDTRSGSRPRTFYETITDAVRDLAEHGYDGQERVDRWVEAIRAAALRDLVSESVLDDALRKTLRTVYDRLVEKRQVLRYHPDVPLFTLDRVKPALRAELDRRIAASANLIRLNRAEAVEKTLRRFQGWATSVPAGGSETVDRVEVKTSVRKALAQLPFAERRVIIDQGHKLTSAINATVAEGGGAIAFEWRSKWRQRGYDYREDHKERDGLVYPIRGSWADEQGLVKPGANGWSDQITQAAEEPFCGCHVVYLYSPKRLPDDCVTAKGRASVEAAKRLRVA